MRRPAVRTPRALAWLALATLAGLLFPTAARAQDTCPSDGGAVLPPNYGQLDDFFPGDNDMGAPRDGFVRLRYFGRVPPLPTLIVTNHVTAERVSGTVNVIGAEVHFHADQPLAANTQYDVAASDISAGAGGDNFTFFTGSQTSSGNPPAFDGILDHDNDGATFVKNDQSDLCGDPNAIEVTVRFRRAQDDDWPANDIEYVVYETRGPNISGPVERARIRGQMGGTSCATGTDILCAPFRLASENAGGQVCFNVQAVDPYGHADGNTQEACTDPEVGNFFNGCTVRPGPARTTPRARPWAALGAVGALAGASVWLARRRQAKRGG